MKFLLSKLKVCLNLKYTNLVIRAKLIGFCKPKAIFIASSLNSEDINTNIFAVGFGPGLTVFSNESIGISAIFKYNYARSDFDIEIGGIKQETITKTNQFDISVGVSFYFSAIAPAASSRTRPSPGY